MNPITKEVNNPINRTDHSLMPPCQAACPLHMDIREYVDLVAQGKVMEALHIIRNGNPFPSICAYVCNHPCEEACRRCRVDKPISIRALKRFAVEFGGDRMVQPEAQTVYDEKVAIIGAGPAGMSCAYYLRKLGYPVTIFESNPVAGGMLRVGIPQYRLAQEVLNGEIQRLINMGVEIRTNTRVENLDELFDDGFKAIFITLGAHLGRKLGVAGEDKPGIIDAVSFLREVNLGKKPAVGERVLVVGGGNVAIDAARASLRLGAKEVNLVCLESRSEMPAFRADIEAAVEEGIILNCSWGVKRLLGEEQVTGIEAKKCTAVFDAEKRFNPSFDENITKLFDSDTTIAAIGQMPRIPESFHLRMGRGSTIQVDPVTLTTSRTGVFAGGDVVTGPATVVQAMASGRLAASRIDDYLRHRYPGTDGNGKESLTGDLLPETIEAIKKTVRYEPPEIPPEVRTKDFQPVEMVYNWESAVNEARRCLRCGMGAEILFQDKCATCLNCLRVCPYHVPRLDANGTIQIPADQCQACGICVAECPAKAIVLRKPIDRRQITEELEHILKSAKEAKSNPLIIGFCCHYGLFGTGALAGLWRGTQAGVWIVPVPCVAKVEAENILRAFEMGAQGVFIAGCGDQCSRENTTIWVNRRVEKVRHTLEQIGIGPECLQAFFPNSVDLVDRLDHFVKQAGLSYLASMLTRETKPEVKK